MKKLIKSGVCGVHEQCTSACSQKKGQPLRLKIKKKKKKKKTEETQTQH